MWERSCGSDSLSTDLTDSLSTDLTDSLSTDLMADKQLRHRDAAVCSLPLFYFGFYNKSSLFHGCFGCFKTRFCLTANLSMAYLFSEWLVQTSWREENPVDLMHDITLIRHCDMKLIFFLFFLSLPVQCNPS